MAVPPKIIAIWKYLQDPEKYPIESMQKDPMTAFVVTFLGRAFMQGYRIFQIIGQHTLVLSLMDYQPFSNNSQGDQAHSFNAQYKIITILMNHLSEEKDKRIELFKNLKQVAYNFDGSIQINILYLKGSKYSIMNVKQLEQTRQPNMIQFYKRQSYLPQRNGYRYLDAKQEGTKLHESVHYLVKGCDQIRNLSEFKNAVTGNNNENKFSYNLQRAINTIRFIIGKQIIENGYIVMNAQKWMRKKTKKQFKRFDLILRNEQKICIIDWKFSKIEAQSKINTRAFVKKNELYYQLARKDYRCQVELKFYCVHIETQLDHYHKFTIAPYDYKIDQVVLDKQEENIEVNQSSNDSEIEFFRHPTGQHSNGCSNGNRTVSNGNQLFQEFKDQYNIGRGCYKSNDENATNIRMFDYQMQSHANQHKRNRPAFQQHNFHNYERPQYFAFNQGRKILKPNQEMMNMQINYSDDALVQQLKKNLSQTKNQRQSQTNKQKQLLNQLQNQVIHEKQQLFGKQKQNEIEVTFDKTRQFQEDQIIKNKQVQRNYQGNENDKYLQKTPHQQIIHEKLNSSEEEVSFQLLQSRENPSKNVKKQKQIERIQKDIVEMTNKTVKKKQSTKKRSNKIAVEIIDLEDISLNSIVPCERPKLEQKPLLFDPQKDFKFDRENPRHLVYINGKKKHQSNQKMANYFQENRENIQKNQIQIQQQKKNNVTFQDQPKQLESILFSNTQDDKINGEIVNRQINHICPISSQNNVNELACQQNYNSLEKQKQNKQKQQKVYQKSIQQHKLEQQNKIEKAKSHQQLTRPNSYIVLSDQFE